MVSVLPLRNDYLENRPVFQALLFLFKTQHTTIMPFIDQLLPVFAQVLDPNNDEQIEQEVRSELLQLVSALNTEIPAKIEGAGLKAFVS